MIDFHAICDRWRHGLPAHDPRRCLNVGSGDIVRPGYINIDIRALPSIDLVADVVRLPFDDRSFLFVECQDVLEHVDIVPAMRELHRIISPGGLLAIQAVHFSSRDYHVDPTHVRAYSNRTFEFFTRRGGSTRSYYFDFAFDHIVYSAIQFHGGMLFWNPLIESLVNRSERTRDLYELTFLCRLFPAANVIAVLRR